MSKPVAIDLCHGLGGWTKGFLAEGYDVIGFDVENFPTYPGQSIKQDVRTLSGYELRAVNPVVILASPPCQAYSYMAMPWDRSKREIRWQEWLRTSPFSTGFVLNDVFNSCIRIAREARCPIVVENVKGAQRWAGRAAWHYGSFYLWGDVPALMPSTRQAQKFNPDGTNHGQGSWFKVADSKNRGSRKNHGGSWFAAAHNTSSGHSQNPVNDGVKVGGRSVLGGSARVSRSSARKSASQAIAEIPPDLAQWIARCFKPVDSRLPVSRAQHASLGSETLQDLQGVAV